VREGQEHGRARSHRRALESTAAARGSSSARELRVTLDYTTGVATHDQAKQKQAVDALTKTYVPEFAAFLAGATDLPEATLASLTTAHVVATKAVVDLQAAGDQSGASTADREAAQHMQMMADPLASAIVAKLPDSF
jgi:hypothetical protein